MQRITNTIPNARLVIVIVYLWRLNQQLNSTAWNDTNNWNNYNKYITEALIQLGN